MFSMLTAITLIIKINVKKLEAIRLFPTVDTSHEKKKARNNLIFQRNLVYSKSDTYPSTAKNS